jgi:hypothetical protein
MPAVRGIADRYEGMTTAQGHAIRVDRRPNEVVLWSPHGTVTKQPPEIGPPLPRKPGGCFVTVPRGDHQGVYGRHRMGIARVEKQADIYLVGWLQGTGQRAYESCSYWDIDKAFGSLDRVIASR